MTCKSILLNEHYTRLENLRGGNIPDYLFIALTPTEALNGSTSQSQMNFQNLNINEINLTLNGNSCLGFPLRIQNNYPIWPFFKLQDALGRLQNESIGRNLRMEDYSNNVVYCHKFEGEETSQGWVGLTLSFKVPLTVPHTLILWTVQNVKTTIDKFCMIEKYNL